MTIYRLFFILLLQLSLFGATDILKTSQVFIDTTGKTTIENISKAKFEPFKNYAYPYSKTSKIHRGYTSESVWIKFSITNSSDEYLKKVLVIDNQMLDHITLYTKLEDTYKEEITGVLHNRRFDDSILDIYFNIEQNPRETKEYYLKVSSLSCAVYFILELMDKMELYKQEINHQLILTLFFGAMLALILYNAFVGHFTKDIAYLYYILYLLFTLLNHLSYSGMGLHILPKIFSWEILEIDAYLAIFYLCFLNIFSLLFGRTFLDIKKYKKLDFGYKLFLAISIIFVIITSPEFYPIDLVVPLFFLSLIYIFITSIYLYFKGNNNAKFLIAGWSFVIIGWYCLAVYQYGYFNFMDSFEYFYELCMFLEAILFSIALSAKLNETKELEIAVNKSKILTRELHHRVKNNMQFIISMYRLKLSKLMDKKLSSILNEIELTIQAMSATHEMLYSKSDLAKIDTKEYFESLIGRISKSFNLQDIEIKTDIDTKLGINESITLGIILNELITNSLKYAFVNNKGTIIINLHKKDKKYKLIYSDNGIGFDSSNHKKSFGTRIIENLVKDDLKGQIEVISNTGITYKIIF